MNKSKGKKALISLLIVMVLTSMLSVPASAAAKIVTVGNGYYTFTTALKSNMVLDVASNSSSNGANVQLYKANSTSAQMFKVTSVGSNYYKITNVATGKALDVTSARKASGVNVQMYTDNGTDAQKWRFRYAGDGYYYIQNKLGYYLDVKSAKTSNGTNVWVYTYNKSNAQKWKLTLKTPATTVTLSSGSFTLTSTGATKKITATITPSDSTDKLTWTSSNTSVATISASGKTATVKAIADGTTTITVKTESGKTAHITVTVDTYTAKANAFISDSRWKNGISWGATQKTKLSAYKGCSQCLAYVCDFAKYVFGVNRPSLGGTEFSGVSNIKAGDILETSKGHWLVVISRSGNKLTTAEGNSSGKVRVSSTAYTISGNTLKCVDYSESLTLQKAYHMR